MSNAEQWTAMSRIFYQRFPLEMCPESREPQADTSPFKGGPSAGSHQLPFLGEESAKPDFLREEGSRNQKPPPAYRSYCEGH